MAALPSTLTQQLPGIDGPSLAARSTLRRLFAIDLRTLALFRILIAAVLIFNIGGRMRDVEMMYGPHGVMPQDVVRQVYQAGEWTWSLYFLNSDVWFQWGLLALTLVVGLLLGLGWKTRLQTVLAWILIVSLHHRAPLLVTGGDVLLSLLIFWGIFLPLGAVWSLDSRGRPRATGSFLSVASAMIMLQMAIMYFFTGISKSNDVWFQGDALANIYEYDLVTRPLGRWLLQFPPLLKAATWATLILELVGPFLMFSPWNTARLRRWTVASFYLLHLAIESTMRVIIFSFVSMAGLSLFVSPRFWERGIGRQLSSLLDRLFASRPRPDSAESVGASRRWVDAAVLALAVGIFAINVPFLWRGSRFLNELNPVEKRVGALLACVQRWDMFATPRFGDFRMVALGTRKDGTQIDLLRDGQQVKLEDPDQLSTSPRTPRWLGMFYDLARNDRHIFRREFARYLMEQWNAAQPPPKQVDFVQLILLVRPKPNLRNPDIPDRYSGREYAFITPPTRQTSKKALTIILDVYDPLVDGTYVNGFKEGRFVVRHPNGNKASEGRYRRGIPEGPWSYWNESGQLEGRGEYKDGEMEGKWEMFYGGRKQEIWFHAGRPVPPPSRKRERMKNEK